ncbi:MAG TPA: FecR domain-containing protein [Puia sp.]|nr:FecR domain-containing protein [Puia sp.]
MSSPKIHSIQLKTKSMNNEDYLAMYEKFLAGTATPAEIRRIHDYQDNFRLRQELKQEPDQIKDLEDRLLARIRASAGIKDNKSPRLRRIPTWLRPAAAAVLLLAAAGLFLFRNTKNHPLTPASPPVAAHHQDIPPGGNKAILTLADGQQIALTDAPNGAIRHYGNLTIKKESNGRLSYVVGDNNSSTSPNATNTISTPRGGQYEVTLPDGTKVWLNALSSLSFPLSYSGSQRQVHLTGEAYFEVAPDKAHPFLVETSHTEVHVLGTSFNIKAYSDETTTTTTLVTGAVKVASGHNEHVLQPGQQSIADQKGSLAVAPANIEEAIAWKDGYFIFHNAGIRDIMRQASRWYDVNIQYEVNTEDMQFGGRISRFSNISELLKNLELTGSVHFSIEGNTVSVTR